MMPCNTWFHYAMQRMPCSESLYSYASGLPCHAVIVCAKHGKGERCYDGQQHCYCNKNPLHMHTNICQHNLCFAAAADSLGTRIQCTVKMSRTVLPIYMQVPAQVQHWVAVTSLCMFSCYRPSWPCTLQERKEAHPGGPIGSI